MILPDRFGGTARNRAESGGIGLKQSRLTIVKVNRESVAEEPGGTGNRVELGGHEHQMLCGVCFMALVFMRPCVCAQCVARCGCVFCVSVTCLWSVLSSPVLT